MLTFFQQCIDTYIYEKDKDMKKILIVNTVTTCKSTGISNVMLAYAKSVSDKYETDLLAASKIVPEDMKDIIGVFHKAYKFKYSRNKNPLKYIRTVSSLIRKNK